MKKAIICCMLVFILSGCSPLLNKNNISSNNSSVETVSQTEKQTEVVNDSFALKAPILKDVNALDIEIHLKLNGARLREQPDMLCFVKKTQVS